jgi:hypothetical protein
MKKKGFEACKLCFDGVEGVDVRLCRSASDVCPIIPETMADYEIKDYLQAGMDKLDKPDMVDHPPHYNNHPSGIECITVTEHMTFNIGNAIKYLWRVDEKDDPFQDLDKAIWYINREIKKRKD